MSMRTEFERKEKYEEGRSYREMNVNSNDEVDDDR